MEEHVKRTSIGRILRGQSSVWHPVGGKWAPDRPPGLILYRNDDDDNDNIGGGGGGGGGSCF
jgi:hypothetical protein